MFNWVLNAPLKSIRESAPKNVCIFNSFNQWVYHYLFWRIKVCGRCSLLIPPSNYHKTYIQVSRWFQRSIEYGKLASNLFTPFMSSSTTRSYTRLNKLAVKSYRFVYVCMTFCYLPEWKSQRKVRKDMNLKSLLSINVIFVRNQG